VADEKGNELHPSPVSFEVRDEWGVFLDLFFELNVAAEVLAKSDLCDDEGALFPVERVRVWGGRTWDPSSINEV
jgi:hypothetical protein